MICTICKQTHVSKHTHELLHKPRASAAAWQQRQQHNSTFRSSLPGLRSAGSKVSGLLVAMSTLMFPLESKPSSWFTISSMVRCTSLSPPDRTTGDRSSGHTHYCFTCTSPNTFSNYMCTHRWHTTSSLAASQHSDLSMPLHAVQNKLTECICQNRPVKSRASNKTTASDSSSVAYLSMQYRMT